MINFIVLTLTDERGPILINVAKIEAVVCLDGTSINTDNGSYSVKESIEEVLAELSKL